MAATGLARVGRRSPPRAGARLLREQPGQPHGLAPRLRGHGAERARGRVLRPLGGAGAGDVGPVPAPRRVARRTCAPCATCRRCSSCRSAGGRWTTTPSSGRSRPTAASTPPSTSARSRSSTSGTPRRARTTAPRAGELEPPRPLRGLGRRVSRGRLPAGHRPPGDGAFLIKNSWGTDFADQGYLWVSYYDASFGKALAVFNGVASADDYDAIYQYDALGRSALDHRRRRRAGVVREPLHRCRVRPADRGLVLHARAGHGVRGARRAARCRASPPRRRPPPARSPSAGTTPSGLERPAAVTAGDAFVVAVRVTTPGWTEPVPVEAPVASSSRRARAPGSRS